MRTFGIDECHRGCVVGPIFIGVFSFNSPTLLEVADSKSLSEKKRLELEKRLTGRDNIAMVRMATEQKIDEVGILNAEWYAIQTAIDHIHEMYGLKPGDRFIMDGNQTPKVRLPFGITIEHMVKADCKVPEVMAASIIAKCEADRWLCSHPEAERYEWSRNKGYLTKRHLELIREHGVSSIHRHSFKVKIL